MIIPTALPQLTFKPQKPAVIKAAITFTPMYAELFRELQKNNQGLGFSPEIRAIQQHLGNYVLVYDDERKIGRAFFMALMGINNYNELANEFSSASSEEKQEFIDYLAQIEDNDLLSFADSIHIPPTPEEWEEAKKIETTLSAEEQIKLRERNSCFWSYYFSAFFNYLSLMVHGAKLTSLVPQAINGDDVAFLKAVQIDRQLLISHPYFKDRKLRAQVELDQEFLSKLSYRESNPPLRGRVRFPALYMLFGILEAYQSLDDFKSGEILDICDQAKLDRYQNRIEDENYLCRRLNDYRAWQNLQRKSMS